ncbi:unnamed protein product [Symbiodinium natans]|uniref:C3H1-type domain-containing protein n=1 Tax=Symbiodinium natans TaxID=878477 RepID=A0A812JRN7_9DINO|nr:unnamed protein product [Symbiodinium natans]
MAPQCGVCVTPREDDLDNLHPKLEGPHMHQLQEQGKLKLLTLLHELAERKKGSQETEATKGHVDCKPCAFLASKNGCRNPSCEFCHATVHIQHQNDARQEARRRRSSRHLADLKQLKEKNREKS